MQVQRCFLESSCNKLTFWRLVPVAVCADFVEETDPLEGGSVAGDMERAGTAGGGPGSVAGDLLWMDL